MCFGPSRAEKQAAADQRIAADSKKQEEIDKKANKKKEDIADAIINAGVKVEKSEIKLPDGSIREVGEFDISIQVHADVTQVVKLLIVAE